MSSAVEPANGSSAVDTLTGPEDETLPERRSRALSLRNAGATFTQIAARCEVSTAQARKDVERARRDLIDDSTRESLIADQRRVILDIRQANYAAMSRGDIDAAKIMLASLEREARLFGLDAPSRSLIGIGTDVEFAETLAGLIESVGYRPPDDLLFTARGDRGGADRDAPGAVIDADTLDAEVIDVDSDGPRAADTDDTDVTDDNASGADTVVEYKPTVISREEWTNI
jgi:hypothetical protein